MLRILWNSKSAMTANQEKLDAISNNLSNVNTDGYKKVNVSFRDLVYESLDRKGYPVTENRERQVEPVTGTGVRAAAWIRDNKQGSLSETSKVSDFAIDGEGFFRVITQNGKEAYTRAGKFEIDSLGRLVDTKGNRLFIEVNAGIDLNTIRFTEKNFAVNEKGEVLLKEQGNDRIIGKIPVFTSSGFDSFVSIGENLYITAPEVQVEEAENSAVMQGYLENSNVDMVEEMTSMILTQRAFELGSRGIKTADEMWAMVNNLKGR